MIDIKVDYPTVKHIGIIGETHELLKEIMLMNCVIAEHIELEEKDGKVYSTAEKNHEDSRRSCEYSARSG